MPRAHGGEVRFRHRRERAVDERRDAIAEVGEEFLQRRCGGRAPDQAMERVVEGDESVAVRCASGDGHLIGEGAQIVRRWCRGRECRRLALEEGPKARDLVDLGGVEAPHADASAGEALDPALLG